MRLYSVTKFFLDCSTLEYGTDRLSRNVGDYQRTLLNIPKERKSHRKSQSREEFESSAQWSEVQSRAVMYVTERAWRRDVKANCRCVWGPLTEATVLW